MPFDLTLLAIAFRDPFSARGIFVEKQGELKEK
jgi:hypothetical protein